MKSYLDFKIIPDLNLIIEYLAGPIDIQLFMQHKQRIINSEFFGPNLKYLLDYREATININQKDILDYIDFAEKNEKPSNLTAFLTQTPKQVLVTQLFQLLKGEKLGKPSSFSTIDAAIQWLRIKENEKERILSTLEELKEKSQH